MTPCEIEENGIVCPQRANGKDLATGRWTCDRHQMLNRHRCAICGDLGVWQQAETNEWVCLEHQGAAAIRRRISL